MNEKRKCSSPMSLDCEVAFQTSSPLYLRDCPRAAGGEEGGRVGSTACHIHPFFTLFLKLGWKFYDADDYHPEENRVKMGEGIPLNDQVTLAINNTDMPAG